MTEHAQLELIAAFVLIAMNVISAWRANAASIHAAEAVRVARLANDVAVTLGAKHSSEIAVVHDAVNGGMMAQKKEIGILKDEVVRLKGLLAVAVPIAIDPIPIPPEKRLNEIRGQE